jgi:phosphomevalonate kinase
MNVEVYAISGKIGTGKNYIAEQVLPTILPPARTLVMALADYLKMNATLQNGLKPEDVWGQKTSYTRQMLQWIGDVMRHEYGDDIFCEILHHQISMYEKRGCLGRVIIPDLRRKNEADYLRQNLDATLIRVEAKERNKEAMLNAYPGLSERHKIATHVSETDLDDFTDWDVVVENEIDQHDVALQVHSQLSEKKLNPRNNG